MRISRALGATVNDSKSMGYGVKFSAHRLDIAVYGLSQTWIMRVSTVSKKRKYNHWIAIIDHRSSPAAAPKSIVKFRYKSYKQSKQTMVL